MIVPSNPKTNQNRMGAYVAAKAFFNMPVDASDAPPGERASSSGGSRADSVPAPALKVRRTDSPAGAVHGSGSWASSSWKPRVPSGGRSAGYQESPDRTRYSSATTMPGCDWSARPENAGRAEMGPPRAILTPRRGSLNLSLPAEPKMGSSVVVPPGAPPLASMIVPPGGPTLNSVPAKAPSIPMMAPPARPPPVPVYRHSPSGDMRLVHGGASMKTAGEMTHTVQGGPPAGPPAGFPADAIAPNPWGESASIPLVFPAVPATAPAKAKTPAQRDLWGDYSQQPAEPYYRRRWGDY